MLDFVVDHHARVRPAGAFKWNDENFERLKELHKKGLSDSQIGADIGCSRNAVAGKISRLRRGGFAADLKSRTKAPAHAPPKKRRSDQDGPPQKRGDRGGGALSGIRRNKEMRLMPAEQFTDLAPDHSMLCLFIELEHGQCRFPLDRDGVRWFCGAPQSEPDSPLNSYCAFHHRLTHQPIDRSKIRSTFQYHA